MASAAPAKRKRLSESKTQLSVLKRAAKRVKTSNARQILAQTSDKALNKNGDLDVSAFVKAREYEIKSMESSMGSSRMSLSSRAFQQVPKDMRRRTASHNVKKVPKRLRPRAAKEMKDDNTPTVTSRRRNPTPHMRLRLETAKKLESLSKRIQTKRKKTFIMKHRLNGPEPARKRQGPKLPKAIKNMLATPEIPPSKYRRRQVHKSWLPTHVWHAKRAHMPEPKKPLWRFAIPLSPTAKVHRPTHRALFSKGCVAWDTSYMSTLLIRGVGASLLGLLRAIGIEETMLSGKKGVKWRIGTRVWQGWIRERDGGRDWMGQVQIIWCAEQIEAAEEESSHKKKGKRHLLLRAHPSAFLQVWTEILKVAKIQKPSPDVEDLRFELGSIEVTGPGSTEALVGTLHPRLADSTTSSDDIPENLWPRLASLTNPSALPAWAALAFDIHDPRLFHPPRKVSTPATEQDLLTTLAEWPLDSTTLPSSIFSAAARYAASRLPSQKSINRRKGDALPGKFPEPLPIDPSIPIMLFASRASSLNMQGTWTLLMPWKCVLPTWYSLIHYPLSTGGNPSFGCLQEKHQSLFEQGQAWFPGDFPGTRAGWQWELMEREKRKKAWEKRPKSKRVSWDAVDLGDGKRGEIGKGWACDWERLFEGPPAPEEPSTQTAPSDAPVTVTEKASEEASASKAATQLPPAPAIVLSSGSTNLPVAPTLPPKPPLSITHLPSTYLSTLPSISAHGLSPVHLSLIQRGVPATCARIYRLPIKNPDLRKKWTSLLTSLNSSTSALKNKSTKAKQPPPLPDDAPAHIKRQALARALLHGPATPADKDEYPACPAEEDLIGFVTTGNFDLGEGRGAAVGNVAVTRIFVSADDGVGRDGGTGVDEEVKYRTLKGEEKVCIVRNAGQSVGRLARWNFI